MNDNKIYNRRFVITEPRHNRNPKRPQHVSRSTRKYLEKALDSEYDFYYWLRARLLQQRSALTPHQ